MLYSLGNVTDRGTLKNENICELGSEGNKKNYIFLSFTQTNDKSRSMY